MLMSRIRWLWGGLILLGVLGAAAWVTSPIRAAQPAPPGGIDKPPPMTPASLPPAVVTSTCVVPSPTRVATPAFTPAPGCNDTPRPHDLRALIIDHPSTTEARFTNRSTSCSYRIGLAIY